MRGRPGGPSGSATGERSRLSSATELLSRHALWAIVCIGAAVRFATVGVQDLWFDEHITAEVIARGPRHLLESVQTSANPPLYYLLAGGWERVFGGGDAAIRSMSALLGTAAIPVVYAGARVLSSRRAALIAAALTATSPILIWYAQEARNYSLLVFLAAVAFLCFAKALDERWGQRWLWGWAISSALALTTHYFAFFLIVPQAAWLLLRRRGSRLDTALAGGAIAIVGVALLPLLATQREGAGWIQAIGLSDRLSQVPGHFVVGFNAPWEAMPWVAVAAVGLLALYGAIRVKDGDRWAIAISASILLSGFALALLAALAGQDFIVSRNLLVLWIPFAIGLAALLGSEAVGRLGVAAAAGLCLVGLALAIWTAATPEAQRPAYSDLAAELGEPQVERLIVSQGAFNRPLPRYLEGGRIAYGEDLSASELVVIDPRRTDSYAVGPCWWVAICGGAGLFPAPRFEPPGEFELQREGSTRRFDYRVYMAPEPVEIPDLADFQFPPRVFAQSPPSS